MIPLKTEEIYKYKEFRIGDKIVIYKEPTQWAGVLGECPLNISYVKVVYPYYCTIQRLVKHFAQNGNDFVAMTEGRFGWSMTTLIKEKIIANTRKLKLQKLNEISLH